MNVGECGANANRDPGKQIRIKLKRERAMASSISFLDLEISQTDGRIRDIGIIRDQIPLHTSSIGKAASFLEGSRFLCGHNIIHHDLAYLSRQMDCSGFKAIDTLYLSPLLFPQKPYHSLVKDDKLQVDQLNNPVNDCLKCQLLFLDELSAFRRLPRDLRQLYCCLLAEREEFSGFFSYLGYRILPSDVPALIKEAFRGRICANADVGWIVEKYPVELAYSLALINADDVSSVTPRWLLHNYPVIENIIGYLRGTPCGEGCEYCSRVLGIHGGLRRIFGYQDFRTYEGEPLQENAVRAAVSGRSLLAVFPTGGGKSITFQLPALMMYEAVHGLTVVISPLQSLMKDQVDNLNDRGITSAVTVNGLLNELERKEALERVADGSASILYISPESLRSRTIQNILFGRNVVRFVIDEAHCFSAWGQDFRTDYQYIGDFIREYQEKKNPKKPIAVSCFTATAKQKVISDIRDYFRRKLGIELELFTTAAARTNLHYSVRFAETDEVKYGMLRDLIAEKRCPTIVYVSRVPRSEKIARHLMEDGFAAAAYHGKMESEERIRIQDEFIANKIRVIVATSAFGMGVDKPDVKLVVHYDISSSLENYLQEAGRAGRDPSLEAECVVLFNNDDLDQHFLLLNQTKLSIGEIQQVWKAIKDNTQQVPRICISPLELARAAGWDEIANDSETRVKAAILALEQAGYIVRGNNVPHVYATGIRAASLIEASEVIDASPLFTDEGRMNAKRILAKLISSRSVARAQNDDAESRVDYIADLLGIPLTSVVREVQLLREAGILADSRDMSAYINASDTGYSAVRTLLRFSRLEDFLLSCLEDGTSSVNLKEINEAAGEAGHSSNVRNLRTILNFLTVRKYISREEDREQDWTSITPNYRVDVLRKKSARRTEISRFCISHLVGLARAGNGEKLAVEFSLTKLHESCGEKMGNVGIDEVEEALLYLSRIGAVKLEGGFLVLYNALQIDRVVLDNRIKFKADDYRTLDEHYKQKVQQIHIVGEYANLMVEDYEKALQYVRDYFQMDYREFVSTYFGGGKASSTLSRNITPKKYEELFGELSKTQRRIIDDDRSACIVVLAGPGSGKTKVLVHKLASLLLMEDVKSDQLLMLTFSRAAATEFKSRLFGLIGIAAKYVEIKTFHSYCFDLLGKVGNIEDSGDVVGMAASLVESGEVEAGKIAKKVLVVDEAQDMDAQEYRLLRALMNANDDMRIIAVGDDDQNIFGFRGSDSRYMADLAAETGATTYEMTENYRSAPNIVFLSNRFAANIGGRMKKTEIVPVAKENGNVWVLRHHGKNIGTAIANDLQEAIRDEKTGVLTSTNEEALLMVGMLKRRGIRARLIQSNEEFDMRNLAEMRYFLKCVDEQNEGPLISDEVWTSSKEKLAQAYSRSSCLENCMNLLERFEETGDKYRSDLSMFIGESSFADFYSEHPGEVYVSTIHKSKGREFDTVYLLLKGRHCVNDEEKRAVYVAMTRAKRNLYVHCDTGVFDGIRTEGAVFAESRMSYPEPAEVILQLTHKDVHLDYFKSRKDTVIRLRSGDALTYENGYLISEASGRTVYVARLSAAGRKKVEEVQNRGYKVSSAQVRFIVAWRGEEDEEETAVILPDIELTKE